MFDSGAFATKEGQKGNFTAYSSELGQVFIPKALMLAKGWKEQKDIKFPFFGLTERISKPLTDMAGKQVKDEQGNPVMINRLQAKSVFATEDEMLKASTFAERSKVSAEAIVAEARLISKLSVAKKIAEAGLTEDTLQSLLNASVA